MRPRHQIPALIVVIAAALLCGCASRFIKTPPPHVEMIVPEARFMVHGMRSELEYETIREAVLKMSPAMQRAIQFISIYGNDDPHIEWDAAAHCHNGRVICTRRENIYGDLIYHETAHARADQIPDSATHAWAKKAASIYGRRYPPNTRFPWRGIVTEYGSKNYKEDIAEWTARVIAIAEDGYANPFTNINKTDPDWIWKLNFLRKWEFITQKQYEKIAPLLK